MASIGQMFHIGASILSTTIDKVTGTILAQLGSVTEDGNPPFADNVEVYGQIGLSSRPSPPTQGQAASECIALKGDRDIIIAARDTRGQQIYGNLKDGETCLYAGGADGQAQGRVLLKADGTVTLYTTDSNTAAGHAVYLQMSQTALNFVAPWGTLQFDRTGFHCITQSGARLDMGGLSIPGVPSSISGAVLGYANLSAPTITIGGNIVNLGNGPTYGLALQAPAAAYTIPTPVMTGPGSQCGSVRITTP